MTALLVAIVIGWALVVGWIVPRVVRRRRPVIMTAVSARWVRQHADEPEDH